MCGIAAMVGFHGRPADRAVVGRMAASMVHRGPDQEGDWVVDSVGFGFRRLAILDLSPAGHQPMATRDGRYVMVFNGEIYNYVELRDELQALGCSFTSSGDSEVLLQSYRQWGPACLEKLNGMWAFVVYDRLRGTVFGARDRFGVKPLYLHRTDEFLLVASEIKAIRASGLHPAPLNWDVASRFLVHDQLDEPRATFYTGIEQLPAGTAFEADLDGRWKEWRYWELPAAGGPPVYDPAEAFAALFEDAVRLRMRSDVPVGVSLSGGLDSTSVICAAARLRQAAGTTERLMAFSYLPVEFDESSYVADTLQQTGADVKRLETDPLRLVDRLTRTLWFHDEPVHSMTALIGFELMELASANGIRVVLNGQGADETLGGYFSYFRDYWYSLMRRGEFATAWREVARYASIHGGTGRCLYAHGMRYLLQAELERLAAYRSLAGGRRRRQRARASTWFTPDVVADAVDETPPRQDRTLDGVLRRSIEQGPLPLYLRIEDRNSMAHSVEARLPFLDYRLVSLAFRLGDDWKLRGSWNKYVLREAMRGRIPESVRARRDKMGFPVPARAWFADALYEPVQDLLGSRRVIERGIYDVPAIRRDLQAHRAGRANVTSQLFNVLQFETLAELAARYVERPPSPAALS
jgi:asparagine synthase (glutamine-hydrolysing)